MLVQLALGTGLILVTIVGVALAFWALEAALLRARAWIARPPHRAKLMFVLMIAVLWAFGVIILGVWVWAVGFLLLDVFPTFEEALYFSLVAFTTLGFGDVLLPLEWRLLAGMSAANGLLTFGVLTAMLVEVMRFARIEQEDDEDTPETPDHISEQVRRRQKARGFFSGGRR